ncbi:MAG: hypothetical protein Q4F65_12020 [Propionibacteriaceae bacterium]|nr:hypothetical protein [Propionibacteriaceae bacterium]
MTDHTEDQESLRDAVAVWGDTHAANRRRLEESRDELRDAVLHALAGGVSEAEAARLSGVTRMTIRAWQGKR